MRIIYNSDGSIKTLDLANSIQQGNEGVDFIYVAIEGVLSGATITADFVLPDGTINSLTGVPESFDNYNGYKITLTQAQTRLAGVVLVDINAVVSATRQYSYQTSLQINPTGAILTELYITQAQYQSMLSSLNAKQDKYNLNNVRYYEDSGDVDLTNLALGQVFLLKDESSQENIFSVKYKIDNSTMGTFNIYAPKLSTNDLYVNTESDATKGISVVGSGTIKINNKEVATKQYVDNGDQLVQSNLTTHINNTSNPHNVTKAQVGLGDVVNKPTDTEVASGSSNYVTSGATYTAIENAKTYSDNKLNVEIGKIVDGTTTVKKAQQDANGNVIATTYETKANAQHSYAVTMSWVNETDHILGIYAHDNTLLAQVNLPIESVVVSGRYDSASRKIILTLASGSEIEIPIGDLISGLQAEITINNKLSADLVNDTNTTNKFITQAQANAIIQATNDISRMTTAIPFTVGTILSESDFAKLSDPQVLLKGGSLNSYSYYTRVYETETNYKFAHIDTESDGLQVHFVSIAKATRMPTKVDVLMYDKSHINTLLEDKQDVLDFTGTYAESTNPVALKDYVDARVSYEIDAISNAEVDADWQEIMGE